jgi:4-hydroxy-3-polyprenylbenzoate decarboxylase
MKLVVGISGASGAIYGLRMLEVLKQAGVETHLVMSDSAKRTIVHETDYTIDAVRGLASQVHDINDIGASIASGSFRHDGMVIAPCSIKTLSAVANSFTTNLLIRAADVTLKERRRLVLMLRETPLHLGHLRLMAQAVEIGAVMVPPSAPICSSAGPAPRSASAPGRSQAATATGKPRHGTRKPVLVQRTRKQR